LHCKGLNPALQQQLCSAVLRLCYAMLCYAVLHLRAGYFASLPCREYLPIFWSDAELDMLQGTALEGRAAGDR
jgi:hypothetical protein